MIWVEILSRNRDAVARFRIAGPEARIGRGYDNDVIVDDPYVAAHHLRVFCDEAGRLVAEDMGSVNGTFLDGGKGRLARIAVDGRNQIRIGQTYLRIRDASYAVEPERLARPDWRILPGVTTASLSILMLGFLALKIWLAQTSELRASGYLTPLLTVAAMVLLWAGLWALLSRIFSGRSRFVSNLLIALAGLFAFTLYEEFGRVAAYAWTWPGMVNYEYIAIWTILAATCFVHLREIGPARLRVKGAIVTTLLLTAIALQTLQRSEAITDYGRQYSSHQLLPPGFRAVAFHDQNAFFDEVGKLKTKFEDDRAAAKPDQSGK